jgi:predicted outer membrane repeat protein
MLDTEIVVKGILHVIGIPDANGRLPVISGNGTNRLFKVENINTDTAALTINNLNLTNGNALGNKEDDFSLIKDKACDTLAALSGTVGNWNGGAILLSGENIILNATNVVFSQNNAANEGGAIYGEKGAKIHLVNTNVTNNVAANNGGGIYLKGKQSKLSIFNGFVSKNHANGATYTGGGGICCFEATSFISKTVVQSNVVTYYGGGILHFYGTLHITNESIVSENIAYSAGGLAVFRGTFYVMDSIIRRNKANDWGGGIRADSYNTLFLIRSTVEDNEGGAHGGGLHLYQGMKLVSIDSTFKNNKVTHNDKVGHQIHTTYNSDTATPSLTLINTIFFGSNGDTTGFDGYSYETNAGGIQYYILPKSCAVADVCSSHGYTNAVCTNKTAQTGITCESCFIPTTGGYKSIQKDCKMGSEIIVTKNTPLKVEGVPNPSNLLVPKIIGGGSNRFF